MIMKIRSIKKETEISAIFIIVLVSMFILSSFFIGFNLSVYFLIMLPVTLIAIKYPKAGFFAIVFLTMIFERFFTLVPIIIGKGEYKLYPIDVLILAMFFGIFISLLKGDMKIKLQKTDFIFLSFILLVTLWGIVSVLMLDRSGALSFSGVKNYAFYGLLFLATALLIKSEDDFKGLFKFFIFGGIGIIGFIAFGFLTGNGLWSQYTPLSTAGIRTLAFTHAFYISLVIVISWAYMLYKDDKLSVILRFLIPIWIIGVIGSMMRHLWISLFVAFVILFIITYKKKKEVFVKTFSKYVGIFIAIGILIFYIATLFPNSNFNTKSVETISVVSDRVYSLTNSYDESIFWRNVVWSEALDEYKRSPILGIGFGEKVSVEIGNYKDFVEIRNIHNSFLVIFVQMGIAGMFLLAWLIFRVIRDASKNKDENKKVNLKIARVGLLATVLFCLVALMFQPYLETNLLGIFFWINLGLLHSLNQTNENT